MIDSAFDHVNKWIQGGVAPPHASRFERDTSTVPATLVRDSYGRVIGGIQLAEFKYPTAADLGAGNTGPDSALSRSHRFYTPQQLAALYPIHVPTCRVSSPTPTPT